VAIEVTATRGREREVCPYCRDRLAGAQDELFECPACATRTHAACRREAGRCTTAGCSGPPPGAAAEAARRRLAIRPARPGLLEADLGRLAGRGVGHLLRARRYGALWAVLGLLAACVAVALGHDGLGVGCVVVGLFVAAVLGTHWPR